MAIRSRIQKSDREKLLDRESVPQRPEPDKPISMEAPKHLSKLAKKLWNERVPELVRKKVLTEWDTESFGVLCSAYGRYRELTDILERDGSIINTRYGLKIHPALKPCDSLLDKLNSYFEKFGMTPMSRRRMDVAPDENKQAKKNKFAGIGKDK